MFTHERTDKASNESINKVYAEYKHHELNGEDKKLENKDQNKYQRLNSLLKLPFNMYFLKFSCVCFSCCKYCHQRTYWQ